jgi:hypothetical protein
MTLNREQIQAMTKIEAEKYLKKFERHYPLNKELHLLPNKHELWDEMDSIVNTLLWLEDHIYKLNLGEIMSAAQLKANKQTVEE